MVQVTPRSRRSRTVTLLLSPAGRIAATILTILPLPGAGAIWVGWRNPHTNLRRNGAMQLLLVIFGSWPLIVPGAVGFLWAVWDARRIASAKLKKLPPRGGADPEATAQKPMRR